MKVNNEVIEILDSDEESNVATGNNLIVFSVCCWVLTNVIMFTAGSDERELAERQMANYVLRSNCE